MKLGTKINLVIVSVTTLVLVATFSVIIKIESDTTRNQVLRDARTSSDIFHSLVERTFTQRYEELARLQNSVNELSLIDGVSYITITSIDGVHLAATDHALVGTSANESDLSYIQEVKNGVSIPDLRINKGSHYEIERRIPVHSLLPGSSSDVISVIEVEVATHSKNLSDIEQAQNTLQAISVTLTQNTRLVVLSQEEDVKLIQTITDSLSSLGKVRDGDTAGFFRDFIISDDTLNIIASTDHKKDAFKNDTDEHNKYREDVLSGNITEATYESVVGGDSVLVTIRPIQAEVGGNSKIVGLIENHLLASSFADRIVSLELRMLIIGIIFTIMLVMVLMAILERQVVGPVRRFSDVAQKIAGGDLNQKVEDTSKDEIGQFGKVFNSMVANFRELDQLKSDFISVAAHQLRTPLSGVKWVIKLLLDGDLGEVNKEQKEMLNRGYETNEKMIQLVNDLLNVSRIENSKFGYDFKKGDFKKLLNTLIENTEITSKQRNIEVQFVNHAENISYFSFDAEKLLIALQNVVDNALKYTLSGGKVTITVEKQGDYVEIKVSDTGVGVPKEELPKLFSKFFRASNVIHLETDGSGLGLFIVKSVIAQHGGKILVDSIEGKGTTVTVIIPTVEELIPREV